MAIKGKISQRQQRKTLTTRLALIGLGVFLAVTFPFVKDATENWIKNVVLQAIHFHWQWEQAQEKQSLFKQLMEQSTKD